MTVAAPHIFVVSMSTADGFCLACGEPHDADCHVSTGEWIDPVVEQVNDECPKCGAYVLNKALHEDWHMHLRAAIEEAQAEARRYKSPPRYGGR